MQQNKLEFWNSRSGLQLAPGSNDIILKRLELDMILKVVRAGSSVLDIGCGDAETLEALITKNECTGTGVDFAAGMLEASKRRAACASLGDRLRIVRGALPALPSDLGTYDYAITERCLINLAGNDEQREAFLRIMDHVKPGGFYLMVESFIQGLQHTNELRTMLGLEEISPPWHNVFLDEKLVERWATDQYVLLEKRAFTSTYYFLSRVVYAKLAADKGEPLRYDSEINLLSEKLPSIGNFGPVRLWIWQRRAE